MKEIHNMTTSELKIKLSELKSTLFNLRFGHVTGQINNPKQITSCKKNIAQVLTVLKERELKIEKISNKIENKYINVSKKKKLEKSKKKD